MKSVRDLRGGDQSGMRAYNRRMILNFIRQSGALPKAEIARATGLSAQAVSVIVNELGSSAAVVVTHDRDVAAAVAERMAVMIDGVIRQEGSVGSVFAMPKDDEVAAVVGIGNVLRGVVADVAAPLVRVEVSGVTHSPLGVWALGDEPVGTPVVVMFGAEAVTVFSGEGPRGSARNNWSGSVDSIRQTGRLVELVVDLGLPVVALITPGSFEALDLGPGTPVSLSVKATAAQAVALPS